METPIKTRIDCRLHSGVDEDEASAIAILNAWRASGQSDRQTVTAALNALSPTPPEPVTAALLEAVADGIVDAVVERIAALLRERGV